jgi:hypothetical protein
LLVHDFIIMRRSHSTMTNHFAKSFVLVFLDWLFAFMDRLGFDFSFGLLFQFDSGYPMSSRDISHHFGTITVFSHTEVGRIICTFKSSKVPTEQCQPDVVRRNA